MIQPTDYQAAYERVVRLGPGGERILISDKQALAVRDLCAAWSTSKPTTLCVWYSTAPLEEEAYTVAASHAADVALVLGLPDPRRGQP